MSQSNSSEKKKIYGPTLPEHLRSSMESNVENKVENDAEEVDDDDDDVYGPCLPQSMCTSSNESKNQTKIIGPCLYPPNMTRCTEEESSNSDDEDGGLIMDPTLSKQIDYNKLRKERRESKSINESDPKKREKWMLEPGKALRQILPTKSVTRFNQKTTKERPLTEEERLEMLAEKEREQRIEEFLKKYEKKNKRDISLLDQHREEMKKSKHRKLAPKQSTSSSVGDSFERQEFDRERDLKNTSRWDSRTKNRFINTAINEFGSRFSSGKFEKYL
ncbi:Ester hydrolase [Sarcoptes scabiei]|nr:Ester hydrolase [Sarcoptes scabiei]